MDPDMEHIHARLSRLLHRQEPVESHFDRLSVDHRGMEHFQFILMGLIPWALDRPAGFRKLLD
jgi:hypothetical protein